MNGFLALCLLCAALPAQAGDHESCLRYPENPVQEDRLRIQRALHLLARDQRTKALAEAQAITTPENLIAMSVDRRFDVLAVDLPRLADLSGAAIDAAFAAERWARRCPRSLYSSWYWQTRLLTLGRFQEVIKIAESIDGEVARRGAGSFGQPGGLDFIFNVSTTALVGMGRPDDAVRFYRINTARSVFEPNGAMQRIWFAQLLVSLDRPADALTLLDEVGRINLIEEHRLWRNVPRYDVALQLADLATEIRLLDSFELHQRTFPQYQQCALFHSEQTNRAVARLVERLENPQTRSDALLSVQNYSTFGANSAWSEKLRARRELIINHPDVLAVIEKVGRVSQFKFYWRPDWVCDWPPSAGPVVHRGDGAGVAIYGL